MSYQLSVSNNSFSNSLSIDSNYQFQKNQSSLFSELEFSNLNGILYIKNYGDELFGTKIEIIKRITDASGIDTIIDISGSNPNFTPNWLDASDGSALFVKTDDISDKEEVYYKGLDYYIQDLSYDVVPAIASEDEETLVIFSSSENDILFLCLDYLLARDISSNPLSQIISYSNDELCFSHYLDDENINAETHRVRFVISDLGRTISVASFDNNTSNFKHLKSFIYPQKIEGLATLTLDLKQNDFIKDITANF